MYIDLREVVKSGRKEGGRGREGEREKGREVEGGRVGGKRMRERK